MNKMTLYALVPCFLLLGASPDLHAAVAQKTLKNTGLKLEPEASYRSRDKVKMVRSFSKDAFEKDRASLPSGVDLIVDFPAVGNQGTQASCVAWALAYAVKSAHEHREHGWRLNNSNHVFSPAYVYNQVNDGRDDGTTIDQAIKLMEKAGTVPLTIMPYDDLDYVTWPTKDQITLGSNFKIGEYRRIAENNIDELKRIIASGEPVVMAVKVYSTFMGDEIKKTNGVYSTAKGEVLINHAVVLVGYDDSRNAFKLVNSWGPTWGDRGYGWLTYDFLPQVAVRAYVVYDTPTPKKIIPYIAGLKSQTLPSPPPIVQPKETFYLVPEERGIKIGETWIRIGDPMSKVKSVMKNPIAQNEVSLMYDDDKGRTIFMGEPGTGRIGQILFLHGMKSESAGQTNRGLNIGDAKNDAHRIYGKPDVMLQNNDAYFYEAVAEDYGGLAWERHITMLVNYDDSNSVQSIKLLKTNKGSMTGSHYVKTSEAERKKSDVVFSLPKDFDEPKKSVWKDIGYGYESMDKFIKKDLSAIPSMMNVGNPEKKNWGGIGWKAYTITSNFSGPSIRAYAIDRNKMFSIVTTAKNKEWYESNDAKQFFDSIDVK
jgi:C1A family cysteine protease